MLPSEIQDSPPIHPTGTSTPPYPKKTLVNALYKRADDAFHDTCDFAEKLDKNKHVYWVYGGPDGFVLAYSLLKYPLDLFYNASKTKTAKALREALHNPWSGAVAIVWLASLSIISAYANGVSKDKNNLASQDFYVNWQAFRDATKGLRNAHRGMRSTLDAIRIFSSIDISYTLLPLGLALGIPSMLNRAWNRYMVTIRKRTMDKNDALSKELLNWGRFNDELSQLPASEKELAKNHANSFLLIDKNNEQNRTLYYINRNGSKEKLKLTPVEMKLFLEKKEKLPFKDKKHPNLLQWHSILPDIAEHHFIGFNQQISLELDKNVGQANHAHNNRGRCYLSSGYGGVVDSLYLFMGLISIVTLSPNILGLVAFVSVVSIFACIATRLQEEYEYDKLLRISEQKAQLISSVKTLQAELARVGLRHIELEQDQDPQSPKRIQAQDEMNDAETKSKMTHAKIQVIYERLHKISSISSTEAALIGLKHGIMTHGTLVCGLFATSVIGKVFFATVLSQYVIAACVLLSIAVTIAAIYSCVSKAATHSKEQAKVYKRNLKNIQGIISKIKMAHDASILTHIENEVAFSNLCDGTPFLNWHLLSWLEILRSMGSGIMKGPKSMDFIWLTLFDASSQHDHKHDNPFLSLLLFASLIFGAITWTLRSLAKFSAKLREQRQVEEALSQDTSADNDCVEQMAQEPEPDSDSDSEQGLERSDSPARFSSQLDAYDFFQTPAVRGLYPPKDGSQSLSAIPTHNPTTPDSKQDRCTSSTGGMFGKFALSASLPPITPEDIVPAAPSGP